MSSFEVQEYLSPHLKRRLFTQADRVLDDTPKDNLVGALGNSYTGTLFTAKNGEDGIVTVEFVAIDDSAYEATENFPRRPLRERRVIVQSLEGPPVYERLGVKEITHPSADSQPKIYTCDYSCRVGESESGDMWGAAIDLVKQVIDEDNAAAGFTPPVPDIISTPIDYTAPSETGSFASETPGYATGSTWPLYRDFGIGSHVLYTERAQYLASFMQKFI